MRRRFSPLTVCRRPSSASPGHLGGRNDWASEPELEGTTRRSGLGGRASQELVSAGFEIGSHGFEHLPVSEASGCSARAGDRRIQGSARAAHGTEVRSYAYPYGALPHPQARSLVERTYAAACTTRVASCRSATRPARASTRRRALPASARAPPAGSRKGSLGSYLVCPPVRLAARRTFRKDYVTLPAERTKH